MRSAVKVCVRLRPSRREELESMNSVLSTIDSNQIQIEHPEKLKPPLLFNFNDVFTEEYSQEEVYESMGAGMISNMMKGEHVCLFAYGQTGSGKTFSMFGTQNHPGLVPRLAKELFDTIRKYSVESNGDMKMEVKMSFFEIYNEKVYDLLSMDQNKKYKIREHPKKGVYVENSVAEIIPNLDEFHYFLEKGNTSRRQSATEMNKTSSRSHAIVTLYVNNYNREDELTLSSKLVLVDLAGSERGKTSGTIENKSKLKEGSNINKSLTTLGTVIRLLSTPLILAAETTASNTEIEAKKYQPNSKTSQKSFIPYRDSTLTWLLKDCLGGNTHTFLLATLSPDPDHYEETCSTLRFAHTAQSIVHDITANKCINKSTPDLITLQKMNAKLIKKIEQLENMLAKISPQNPSKTSQETLVDSMMSLDFDDTDFCSSSFSPTKMIPKDKSSPASPHRNIIESVTTPPIVTSTAAAFFLEREPYMIRSRSSANSPIQSVFRMSRYLFRLPSLSSLSSVSSSSTLSLDECNHENDDMRSLDHTIPLLAPLKSHQNSLSIRINKHGFIQPAFSKGFHVYFITIQTQLSSWTIARRFSQLYHLMQHQKQYWYPIFPASIVESFPNRQETLFLFSKTAREDLISQRQTQLDHWADLLTQFLISVDTKLGQAVQQNFDILDEGVVVLEDPVRDALIELVPFLELRPSDQLYLGQEFEIGL